MSLQVTLTVLLLVFGIVCLCFALACRIYTFYDIGDASGEFRENAKNYQELLKYSMSARTAYDDDVQTDRQIATFADSVKTTWASSRFKSIRIA